jgi:hypothetical protein
MLLRHQCWPFITVNKAALDYSAFNDPVLYRRGDICLLYPAELTPHWWAFQNRFLIGEIGR